MRHEETAPKEKNQAHTDLHHVPATLSLDTNLGGKIVLFNFVRLGMLFWKFHPFYFHPILCMALEQMYMYFPLKLVIHKMLNEWSS